MKNDVSSPLTRDRFVRLCKRLKRGCAGEPMIESNLVEELQVAFDELEKLFVSTKERIRLKEEPAYDFFERMKAKEVSEKAFRALVRSAMIGDHGPAFDWMFSKGSPLHAKIKSQGPKMLYELFDFKTGANTPTRLVNQLIMENDDEKWLRRWLNHQPGFASNPLIQTWLMSEISDDDKNYSAIRCFLNMGWHPDRGRDRPFRLPLMSAATACGIKSKPAPKIMKALLDAGADPNHASLFFLNLKLKGTKTPLEAIDVVLADARAGEKIRESGAFHQWVDCARMLIDHGAVVEKKETLVTQEILTYLEIKEDEKRLKEMAKVAKDATPQKATHTDERKPFRLKKRLT